MKNFFYKLIPFLMVVVFAMQQAGCESSRTIPQGTPTAVIHSTTIQIQKKKQSTPTPLVNQTATQVISQPLIVNSDSEEIRYRILNSHNHWKTLWADATTGSGTFSNPTNHTQLWVNRPSGQFRLLNGTGDGSPTLMQVADGEKILRFDRQSGASDITEEPPSILGEFIAPISITNTIQPYPMAGLMETPLSEMIFPTALAQRGGTYTPISIDEIAGREALVVDWSRDGKTRIDRLWVDTNTGVILRWQGFGKDGSPDKPLSEVTLNAIRYDEELPQNLFSTQLSIPPEFAQDYTGKPVTNLTPVPTQSITQSMSKGRMIYFVINPFNGQDLKLVRLPGSCLQDGNCPEPEVVPDFPNQRAEVRPLAWSPDGSQAVLPYGPLDTPAQLYRFEPDQNRWTKLVEFDYIQPPTWSPDGQWVAFLAQRGDVENLYMLRPDGSDLQNLTEKMDFKDDTHMAISGWVKDRLLVMVEQPSSKITANYLLKPGSKKLEPLIELGSGKVGASVSPDEQWLVYSSTNQESGDSIFIQPVYGGQPKRLASFQQSSVYGFTWSPDGKQVAFITSVSPSQDKHYSTVYTLQSDGTDLRQLYTTSDIMAIHYSPDGKSLLIEGDDGTSNIHLFWTPIEGGKPTMLQAPGLPLDAGWMGSSWQ